MHYQRAGRGREHPPSSPTGNYGGQVGHGVRDSASP